MVVEFGDQGPHPHNRILSALPSARIMGAIAILPIVASYPIIEKIWLSKYLGLKVVAEHEEITE